MAKAAPKLVKVTPAESGFVGLNGKQLRLEAGKEISVNEEMLAHIKVAGIKLKD